MLFPRSAPLHSPARYEGCISSHIQVGNQPSNAYRRHIQRHASPPTKRRFDPRRRFRRAQIQHLHITPVREHTIHHRRHLLMRVHDDSLHARCRQKQDRNSLQKMPHSVTYSVKSIALVNVVIWPNGLVIATEIANSEGIRTRFPSYLNNASESKRRIILQSLSDVFQ